MRPATLLAPEEDALHRHISQATAIAALLAFNLLAAVGGGFYSMLLFRCSNNLLFAYHGWLLRLWCVQVFGTPREQEQFGCAGGAVSPDGQTLPMGRGDASALAIQLAQECSSETYQTICVSPCACNSSSTASSIALAISVSPTVSARLAISASMSSSVRSLASCPSIQSAIRCTKLLMICCALAKTSAKEPPHAPLSCISSAACACPIALARWSRSAIWRATRCCSACDGWLSALNFSDVSSRFSSASTSCCSLEGRRHWVSRWRRRLLGR